MNFLDENSVNEGGIVESYSFVTPSYGNLMKAYTMIRHPACGWDEKGYFPLNIYGVASNHLESANKEFFFPTALPGYDGMLDNIDYDIIEKMAHPSNNEPRPEWINDGNLIPVMTEEQDFKIELPVINLLVSEGVEKYAPLSPGTELILCIYPYSAKDNIETVKSKNGIGPIYTNNRSCFVSSKF